MWQHCMVVDMNKLVPGSVSLIELKSSCIPCWPPPRAHVDKAVQAHRTLLLAAHLVNLSLLLLGDESFCCAPIVGSEAQKPGKYNKKLVPNPKINAKCNSDLEKCTLRL